MKIRHNHKNAIKAAKYNDKDYTIMYEVYVNDKATDKEFDTEDEAYDYAEKLISKGKSNVKIYKNFYNYNAKSHELSFVDAELCDTISDKEVKASRIPTRRRAIKSSRNRRRITAATGSYESDMKKIQYYAQRVMEDIREASNILQNEGWAPIEVPEVDGDEYFYDWYVNDYVDLFDSNHSGNEELIKSYNRRGAEFDVSYGQFNSKDLYNYGDSVDDLMLQVESYPNMEDLYMVTYEYGFTIEDLANDPYAVFEHWDEEDRIYYAEEVLDEFDLLTQSDSVYDMTSDARGIVNLYNEVANYFSYDSAETALQDYYADSEGY